MFFGGGFPFGFGGHGHHQDEEEEEHEQEETLYSLLQVSQDATLEEIKEKHKQLTDKLKENSESQDSDLLQQINQAFEVLSDPEKRKIYDQQRRQQKKLLEMMYGAQVKGKSQGQQKPKMQPTKRGLSVSLEKLYCGGNVTLPHDRARICEACQGTGGPNVSQCTTCKGRGSVVKMAQVGPGMYTQIQANCNDCEGKGDIFGEGGKCQTCEGRKIVKKNIDLEVPIPKGSPPGHIITLQGEGNELHNARAGDLILVVQEEPHEQFTRKGADLFYKKTVTLIEALLGFNFQLTHLDGKKYTIYTNAKDIIGDGHKKVVRNLGMPFFKTEQEHGNLIIDFKVQMPKRGQLTPLQLKALSTTLPGKINDRPIDTNYEMLQDFDKQLVNSNEEGGKKEEEEGQEQEGVGCQAQ